MIIEEQKHNVNNTDFQKGAFKVEEDPLLFWVMSNSLYEYKERAVLRELAANGWDAHYEAGVTHTPVRIQLPTDMEPTLIIQDFGVGMSYQHLQDYYFAYFKSSKRKSKNSIGGYGIGCKTPFILSDTYTVITVKDGLKTVAVANLDAGIPVPTFVTVEEPTDEPNGTTVSIPVDSTYSIMNCKREAFDLFYQWPVQPKITLGSEREFEQKEQEHTAFNDYLYLTDVFSYYIRPNEQGFNTLIGNFTIGMFEYASTSSLNNRTYAKYEKEINDRITLLKTIYHGNISRLNFNVNVGELKLSPSRETVEDTDENAEMLYKYFDKAVTDLTETVKKKVIPYINTIKEAFKDVDSNFSETFTVVRLKKIIEEIETKYTKEFYSTLNSYIDYLESVYRHDKKHKPDTEIPKEVKALYELENNPYLKHVLFGNGAVDTVRSLSIVFNISSFYRDVISPKLNNICYKVVQNSNYNPKRQQLYMSSITDVEDKECIIVAKPSVVFNYASYHDTFEIQVDPQDPDSKVHFNNILITKTEEDRDVILRNFPDLEELSPSRFEIPKTKRVGNRGQTRKPNFSPVFSVVKDFTGTVPKDKISSSPIIASDWYDIDFPEDTVFVIRKYSIHGNYDVVSNRAGNHFIEGNVVVLVEGKQGELATKRAEKFFSKFSEGNIYYVDNNFSVSSVLKRLSKGAMKKYIEALVHFDIASSVFDFNARGFPYNIIELPKEYRSSYGHSKIKQFFESFDSFYSLYRYILKNSMFKYSLWIIPKEHRKQIVKLAVSHDVNASNIDAVLTMDLQGTPGSMFQLPDYFEYRQKSIKYKKVQEEFESGNYRELKFLQNHNFTFDELEMITSYNPAFKEQAQSLYKHLVDQKDSIYTTNGD